jgi:hypothetical protein
MEAGANGAKIPAGLLFPDPLEKGLKFRRAPQRLDRWVELLQLNVREYCMKLLVAWLAERDALLGLAAARFGMEMMERNQPRGNFPAA